MTLMVTQTPGELLDYTIDWVTRGLGSDTISSSIFSSPSADITVSNTSIVPSPSSAAANSATTFWITGGIPGSFYAITNQIVTSGGRTMQETVTYECINARTT